MRRAVRLCPLWRRLVCLHPKSALRSVIFSPIFNVRAHRCIPTHIFKCHSPVPSFEFPGMALYARLSTALMWKGVASGLTSRPVWNKSASEPNPYSNAAQAQIIQQMCSELHLQRVILAGHSDGALIALMAAAQTVRCCHTCCLLGKAWSLWSC